jgi:hypothetical protein
MKNTIARWKEALGRLPVNEDLREVSIVAYSGGWVHLKILVNGAVVKDASLNERQVAGLRRFYKKVRNSEKPTKWYVLEGYSYTSFTIAIPVKRAKLSGREARCQAITF